MSDTRVDLQIQRLRTAKTNIITSIENKGVTVPSGTKYDGFPTLIDKIPTYIPDVWEGVNFLDYDGQNIEAWPAVDVASKTTLPTPLTHEGLTFSGWNWTLAQIKSYISSYPKAQLFIGPKYYPTDGYTHIFIRLTEGNLSPFLNFKYRASGGTGAIDWGDGSTTSLANASADTLISTQHIYSTPGDYEIKIKNVTRFIGYCGAAGNALLSATEWTTSVTTFRNADIPYTSSIRGVWLQSNGLSYQQAYLLQQARNCEFFVCNGYLSAGANCLFYNTCGIKRVAADNRLAATNMLQNDIQTNVIAFPYGETSIGGNHFRGTGIYALSIPDSVTTMGTNVFYNDTYLRKVIIPSSITSIPNNTFYTCTALSYLDLPSTITSLGTSAFYNCYSLGYLLFRPTTPPTVSNSNTFTGLPTTCTLIVPVANYTNYKSANNYPSSSSYQYDVFGTYTSGETLPSTVNNIPTAWYATIEDLKNGINSISTGNGKEVYGGVGHIAKGLNVYQNTVSSTNYVIQINGQGSATYAYYKYNTTMPYVGSTLDNTWLSSMIAGGSIAVGTPPAATATLYVVTLDSNNKVVKGGTTTVTHW